MQCETCSRTFPSNPFSLPCRANARQSRQRFNKALDEVYSKDENIRALSSRHHTSLYAWTQNAETSAEKRTSTGEIMCVLPAHWQKKVVINSAKISPNRDFLELKMLLDDFRCKPVDYKEECFAFAAELLYSVITTKKSMNNTGSLKIKKRTVHSFVKATATIRICLGRPAVTSQKRRDFVNEIPHEWVDWMEQNPYSSDNSVQFGTIQQLLLLLTENAVNLDIVHLKDEGQMDVSIFSFALAFAHYLRKSDETQMEFTKHSSCNSFIGSLSNVLEDMHSQLWHPTSEAATPASKKAIQQFIDRLSQHTKTKFSLVQTAIIQGFCADIVSILVEHNTYCNANKVSHVFKDLSTCTTRRYQTQIEATLHKLVVPLIGQKKINKTCANLIVGMRCFKENSYKPIKTDAVPNTLAVSMQLIQVALCAGVPQPLHQVLLSLQTSALLMLFGFVEEALAVSPASSETKIAVIESSTRDMYTRTSAILVIALTLSLPLKQWHTEISRVCYCTACNRVVGNENALPSTLRMCPQQLLARYELQVVASFDENVHCLSALPDKSSVSENLFELLATASDQLTNRRNLDIGTDVSQLLDCAVEPDVRYDITCNTPTAKNQIKSLKRARKKKTPITLHLERAASQTNLCLHDLAPWLFRAFRENKLNMYVIQDGNVDPKTSFGLWLDDTNFERTQLQHLITPSAQPFHASNNTVELCKQKHPIMTANGSWVFHDTIMARRSPYANTQGRKMKKASNQQLLLTQDSMATSRVYNLRTSCSKLLGMFYVAEFHRKSAMSVDTAKEISHPGLQNKQEVRTEICIKKPTKPVPEHLRRFAAMCTEQQPQGRTPLASLVPDKMTICVYPQCNNRKKTAFVRLTHVKLAEIEHFESQKLALQSMATAAIETLNYANNRLHMKTYN